MRESNKLLQQFLPLAVLKHNRPFDCFTTNYGLLQQCLPFTVGDEGGARQPRSKATMRSAHL